MVMLQIKRLLGHAFVHPIQVVDLQLTEIAHHMRAKSNSNRMIFFFPLSHYKGKSPFSISTYMEEVFEQIDFLSFLYGKGDAMSPLSIGDWREIIGD